MQDITSKTFFLFKVEILYFSENAASICILRKFQAVKSAVLLSKEAITKYHELSGSNKVNFLS